ncbi:hypothetical protein SYNPS1DRAFT_29190 [Syncephalis pseudoplumigaleata]|uniref:Uncharacterized protein n=1 Tax=Syncephalis pseudoplumigaleata TaxID=1712513 RepID=A0A4P9YY86_9FUNG|nr:hypothetical protein SYNPS1DRAFT_29190 [Syncephalis pseudoplumigaleata]|eukprot:RKP25066.1 hypothetical protein SYNPS1DRAFT_29190 [Syncephalis pseudoplumigaleata]
MNHRHPTAMPFWSHHPHHHPHQHQHQPQPQHHHQHQQQHQQQQHHAHHAHHPQPVMSMVMSTPATTNGATTTANAATTAAANKTRGSSGASIHPSTTARHRVAPAMSGHYPSAYPQHPALLRSHHTHHHHHHPHQMHMLPSSASSASSNASTMSSSPPPPAHPLHPSHMPVSVSPSGHVHAFGANAGANGGMAATGYAGLGEESMEVSPQMAGDLAHKAFKQMLLHLILTGYKSRSGRATTPEEIARDLSNGDMAEKLRRETEVKMMGAFKMLKLEQKVQGKLKSEILHRVEAMINNRALLHHNVYVTAVALGKKDDKQFAARIMEAWTIADKTLKKTTTLRRLVRTASWAAGTTPSTHHHHQQQQQQQQFQLQQHQHHHQQQQHPMVTTTAAMPGTVASEPSSGHWQPQASSTMAEKSTAAAPAATSYPPPPTSTATPQPQASASPSGAEQAKYEPGVQGENMWLDYLTSMEHKHLCYLVSKVPEHLRVAMFQGLYPSLREQYPTLRTSASHPTLSSTGQPLRSSRSVAAPPLSQSPAPMAHVATSMLMDYPPSNVHRPM